MKIMCLVPEILIYISDCTKINCHVLANNVRLKLYKRIYI